MLTQAQLVTLKADVLANADTLAAYNIGDRATLAALYNAPAVPAAPVWDKAVPVYRIHDAIDDTKYTPADAPDGTVLFSNRANVILIKQMNLQTMLIGPEYLDATKTNVRTKVKDATTAVPAGASGNNVHPGGANGATVLAALLRPKTATRFEKLFSSGPRTTGSVTGEVLTLEGDISPEEFVEI